MHTEIEKESRAHVLVDNATVRSHLLAPDQKTSHKKGIVIVTLQLIVTVQLFLMAFRKEIYLPRKLIILSLSNPSLSILSYVVLTERRTYCNDHFIFYSVCSFKEHSFLVFDNLNDSNKIFYPLKCV